MEKIVFFIVMFMAVLNARCCIEYSTCSCKTTKDKITKAQGKKLDCVNANIDLFDLFGSGDFHENTAFLEMLFSRNAIEEISRETFGDRPQVISMLQQVFRLDLSENKIQRIMPQTFAVFPNLTHLNLSSNSIGRLSQNMFYGLAKLKVLDLSGNFFPIIPGDAFTHLTSLRKLLVESTDLVCNCLMLPFISWLRRNSTKPIFRVIGTCHLPLKSRGSLLKKLDPQTLTCEPNNTLTSLPHFEMNPTEPQLAFEGDEIVIQCEGTDLSTSKVIWSHNGKEVDMGVSSSFVTNTTQNFYRTLVAGQLRISDLTMSHSGQWNCTIASKHGYETRILDLLVVGQDSSYCGESNTSNQKGDFSWPETIAGVNTSHPCPVPTKDRHSTEHPFAQRQCLPSGQWITGDYGSCPYKDVFTRLTYNTLQMNLTPQNVFQLVQNLFNSLKSETIRESYSVELIARLMEIMIKFIYSSDVKEGSQILHLASLVMNANVSVLREAQRQSRACERVLRVVRAYALKAGTSPAVNEFSTNIAMSVYNISSKTQYNQQGHGMWCRVEKGNSLLKFACGMTQKQTGTIPSISLPNSLFDSLKGRGKNGFKLYFIAYRNDKLFQPVFANTPNNSDNETGPEHTANFSSNMVLEAGVNGEPVTNLSIPAIFSFENPKPRSHYPAIWSPSRGWHNDGSCHVTLTSVRNSTQIECSKIANITLLYDPNIKVTSSGSDFSLSSVAHPAVFVGTGALIICLLAVMLSYMCCSSKLLISSDARHMLVNICIHLLLLACSFTLGIWRVDYKAMCLACGIMLHYASLSVLLWITISARNIHREMVIYTRPPSIEPKPPRPMLRFYLIGCGIPTVVCGITAAAKMQNYDGDDGKYCWLSWETSVFAFYLPAALIAIVCVILLIRILCSLNRHPAMRSSIRGSPMARGHNRWQNRPGFHNHNDRYDTVYNRNITEDTPLQYMNQNQITNESMSPTEISSSHVQSTNEQSFRTRLRGVSLLLFFFLATWVAAAISVAAPSMEEKSTKGPFYPQYTSNMDYSYQQYLNYPPHSLPGRGSYLSSVFSYVYAFLAAATGIFLVFQHLICRHDVRMCWGDTFGTCNIKRKGYRRNPGSQASSAPVPDGNYGPSEEFPMSAASYNDKTSSPKRKKKRQKESFLAQDPTTLETEVEEELSSQQLRQADCVDRDDRSPDHLDAPTFIPTSTSSIYPPKSPLHHSNNVPHGYHGHHHHHQHGDHRVNSFDYTQQSPSAHSAYMLRQSEHQHSSPPPRTSHSHILATSSGRMHSHHLYPHDPCMVSSRHPGHQYADYGHYHHHHGHHSYSHQQMNGKALKLTNLQLAHDSSMTEHSFDDLAHNNMHTIPVVLQQHSQPKVDNSLLYNRYQKMRRALEQKRGRQKKLTVLREYAHDPLTSNDEDDSKAAQRRNMNRDDMDEMSPLIQSPEKLSPLKNTDYGLNALDAAMGGESWSGTQKSGGDQSTGGSKYRMLLISSPTNRKKGEEYEQPQRYSNRNRRPGGPMRHRRTDSRGHQRHSRSTAAGDRNGGPGRRIRQSKRRSHNSTLSERERDTTSSGKSEVRKDDGDGLVELIRRPDMMDRDIDDIETITDYSIDHLPIVESVDNADRHSAHHQESNSSLLTSDYKPSTAPSGKDNHGYLTLTQLMAVNPLIPQTQKESKPSENQMKDVFLPSNGSDESDLSLSSDSEPTLGLLHQGNPNLPSKGAWIEETGSLHHGDTDVSESKSQRSTLPLRSETSV